MGREIITPGPSREKPQGGESEGGLLIRARREGRKLVANDFKGVKRPRNRPRIAQDATDGLDGNGTSFRLETLLRMPGRFWR